MNETGPKDCCLGEANVELVRKIGEQGSLARCRQCGRSFLRARMLFDEMCIDPLDYRLWQEVEPDVRLDAFDFSDRAGERDLADYIMNHKPYYACNTSAGGEYQRVE